MTNDGANEARPGRGGALACLLVAGITAWSPAAAGAPLAAPPADADAAVLEAKIAQRAELPDLLALAHRSSPMIRAARAEWTATVEKYRVDTAWADPELMVEGMYPTETLGREAAPMDWSVGLSQQVPLPGRQGAAGAVTREEARVGRLKLDAAVRDVTYEVRRSVAELRYLAEAREIARGQRELVGKLVAAGAAAYAGERASLFEVMKARAQAGQVDYDVLLLDEAERTERARLNALLDRPPDAAFGPVAAADGGEAGALAFSDAEIDALAQANFEDLRIAGAEVRRAEAMAKLTRYETLPELKLGVSYGRSDDVDQVGVQAGVMVPLWRGKNAGRLAGAQADVEKMRAMERSRLNDLRAKLRDTLFRLRNAERLVALYRDDLVPQAERALEIAQARVEQRLGSLGDAAEARSAWYGFRLALARARADHGTLLASLESFAGRSLTRRDAPDAAGPSEGVNSPLAASPGPAGQAPEAAGDRGAAAFAAASRDLRQLEAEWAGKLAGGTGDAAFFVPDPERARMLAPAAADDAAAAAALADGFALETLEALALLRSPMVAAKQAEAKAALELFDQADQIDVVLRRYASLTGAAMAGGGMGRTPDFPFPTVLALKGRIAAEQVAVAREELEAARREAVTMARTTYWELLYLAGAVEITRSMIDLLENLSGSVTARYESGETSFQDVLRVRVEREKAREELTTLVQERGNTEAQLRGLLALPPGTPIGSPAAREAPAAPADQARLEALALERRQELRAATAMVERMELMLEMAETMTYPGFDLGLAPTPAGLALPAATGETMSSPSGGSAAMDAGGARPAPPARPFFAGDEAYLRELRQRVAALHGERASVRAETLVRVRGAWFAFDRARREAALYGERVLPLSQAAVETSLRGYTAGKVMFSDLLESYTGWLEGSLARERARADLGIARAGLEAAAGTSTIEGQP